MLIGYQNFYLFLRNIIIQSTAQRKWHPFNLVKKQMKKKSIPISKAIEKFENQKLIYVNYLEQVIIKVFTKGDSTNWSYNSYTITEVIHDTVPSYRINYLPERYNQNLLIPTKLTLEENNQVMKKLSNLIQ